MGGIGPGPFAAMLLADHGAHVIRVDRPGATFGATDTMLRSRTLVTLDLKQAEDVLRLRQLIATADGLIEGFRPGVMERLGLDPRILLADNQRLVVGRMTGWGQTGPLAATAGHDLNYIALSGALAAIGLAERPIPPLALVGDLGGGGMVLALGMTAAFLHARNTGRGQVIDCAMAEGAALLMTAFYGLRAAGEWNDRRASNLLDGGAPFYATYETADGRFVTVAPLEPQFYKLLLRKLDIENEAAFTQQMDRDQWPAQSAKLAAIFRTRSRDEWCALLEQTDTCFAPVLSMAEAPNHPQARTRGSFVAVDGVTQPAPAPRYSQSPLAAPRPAVHRAFDVVLAEQKAIYRSADQ